MQWDILYLDPLLKLKLTWMLLSSLSTSFPKCVTKTSGLTEAILTVVDRLNLP